jgi:hypothetical protein
MVLKKKGWPWCCMYRVIAATSGTEDPGSNPAHGEGRAISKNMTILLCIPGSNPDNDEDMVEQIF